VVRLVAVGRIVESRLTPPFGEGEERRDREWHQQPAADPVADGRFDQQNEEELVDRRADLVLVDEDEGRDDDGVDVNPSRPISRGARAKPSQRLSRKKPTPTTASRPVVAQAQPS